MGSSRRRRLLFFAYYYPPLGGAGSQRALSLARHLPALGWDISVVTPREGVYGVDASSGGEDLPGVQVVRTGTLEPAVVLRPVLRRKRGGGRGQDTGFEKEAELGPMGRALRSVVRKTLYFPDSARGWTGFAIRAALRAHRAAPFGAVLSSSPPISCHVAARKFSRETGVPWVSDWRDLWSADTRSGGVLGPRAVRLEKELLLDSRGITGATEGVVRIQTRIRGAGCPAAVVRNGFDPADFGGEAPCPVRSGTIVHAGTLYGPEEQETRDVFRAFRRMVDADPSRSRFRMRFLGKVHDHHREQARREGVEDRVDFEGFQDHAAAVASMRSAAVLLLLGSLRTSEAGLASVPAKSYEYLAAGRPILSMQVPNSEMEEVLGRNPAVTTVRYGDADAIHSALVAMMGPDGLPSPPPSSDISRFSRRAAALGMNDLLDAAVAAGVAP